MTPEAIVALSTSVGATIIATITGVSSILGQRRMADVTYVKTIEDRVEINAARLDRAEADLRKCEASKVEMEQQIQDLSLRTVAVGGIIVLNEQGIICFIDGTAAGALGYEAEELEGQAVSMLMSPSYAKKHEDALAAYIETGVKHFDWERRPVVARSKTGKEVPLILSVREYRVLGERFFQGTLRTI